MIISNKNLYKGVFILIFSIFLVRLMTENFHLPYLFNSVMDLFAIVILIISLYIEQKKIPLSIFKPVWIIFLYAISIGVLSNVIRGGALYDIINGWVIYLRIFIGIVIGALLFNAVVYKKFIKYIKILMIINVLVMTVQYFFFSLKQDKLGGVFGNTQGCNGVVNILCCIYVLLSISDYMIGREPLKKLIISVVITCYVGAITELTVVYFELVLIIVLSVLFTKKKKISLDTKKLSIIVVGVIGVFLGVRFYLYMFPDRAFLLNYNELLMYLGAGEKGTGVYEISRARVFHQLGNRFFSGILDYLFGFGIGNCTMHSLFYQIYGTKLHYNYFSSAMTFLESGILGVASCLGTCLLTFVTSRVLVKKTDEDEKKLLLNFSSVFAIIVIVNFFYNSSTRDLYTSYLCGVLLAIPFAINYELKNNKLSIILIKWGK